MELHSLFKARDIQLIIQKGSDKQILDLLHQTVWGTPGGIRYQKITSTETENYFKDNWFLKLMKGKRLLAVAGMVHHRYLVDNYPVNAFYLRSFSFHPKYQVNLNPEKTKRKTSQQPNNQLIKRFLSRFLEKGEFFQNLFPNEGILFYGYVIGNNERSARFSKDLGLAPFRSFSTMLFSRRFPKKNPNLTIIPKEDFPKIQNHIQRQYQDYPLANIQQPVSGDDFFVLMDNGQPVAGLRARKVGWKIKEIPGFSGKIMMNLLPYIPFISTMFNPKNFQFFGIDSIFLLPGHEDKLEKLFEAVCAHYKVFIAMMWIDEKSDLFQAINNHVSLGLLNQLSRNTDQVNVIGQFINIPEEVKNLIISHPAYVEMNEVT